MVAGQNADISWATKASFVRSNDFPDALDVVPGEVVKKWGAGNPNG